MSVVNNQGQIVPLVILASSMAYIAGLAWNEAIKQSIDSVYPYDRAKNAQAQILYAVIVTIIIILVAYLINYANQQAPKVASQLETSLKKTANELEHLVNFTH
jgi:hypothetical protein